MPLGTRQDPVPPRPSPCCSPKALRGRATARAPASRPGTPEGPRRLPGLQRRGRARRTPGPGSAPTTSDAPAAHGPRAPGEPDGTPPALFQPRLRGPLDLSLGPAAGATWSGPEATSSRGADWPGHARRPKSGPHGQEPLLPASAFLRGAARPGRRVPSPVAWAPDVPPDLSGPRGDSGQVEWTPPPPGRLLSRKQLLHGRPTPPDPPTPDLRPARPRMEPRGAGSAGTLGSGSPSRGREDEDGVGGGVPERCPCGGAQLTLEPGPGERPCACPHPGGREREGEQAAFLTPDARRVQTLVPRAGTGPCPFLSRLSFSGPGLRPVLSARRRQSAGPGSLRPWLPRSPLWPLGLALSELDLGGR